MAPVRGKLFSEEALKTPFLMQGEVPRMLTEKTEFIADFNMDGFEDKLVADGNCLKIFMGVGRDANGLSRFAPLPLILFQRANPVYILNVGDFERDGEKPDGDKDVYVVEGCHIWTNVGGGWFCSGSVYYLENMTMENRTAEMENNRPRGCGATLGGRP